MKKLFLLTFLGVSSLLCAENLLSNGGFEESSSSFLGTSFDDWSCNGMGVETSDVIEGEQAAKTENATLNINTLQQKISYLDHELKAGTVYKLKINYKVLTSVADGSGNDIKLDCYWEHRTNGELGQDAEVLKTDYFTASDWTLKEVKTVCPENASAFHFRVQVAKNVVALFDDFSFEETSESAADTPELTITPTSVSPITAEVGVTAEVARLSLHQVNLTSPVTFELTGADADKFSLSKTSSTAASDEVVVSFQSATEGVFQARLLVDCANHTEFFTSYSLKVTCVDAEQPAQITVEPTSLEMFSAKVGETVSKTVSVSSSHCSDYVSVSVENVEGSAFSVNNSLFPKNMTADLRIDFSPKEAGTFKARITLSSTGAASVVFEVNGTATAADPAAELQREFVWDTTNPRKLLIEDFESVTHNKTLVLEDWQNVAKTGERAWWGYDLSTNNSSESGYCAKATAYIFGQTQSDRWEMWLMTPPLDFVNAASKLFTFRVRGDYMPETHDTKCELYYVEPETAQHEAYFQNLEIEMPTISDQNGEWFTFHVDLTGQDIADVFYMAFRFEGVSGSDGAVTYLIDDVSWGRADLPQISLSQQIFAVQTTPATPTVAAAAVVSARNLTQPITLKLGGPNASKFKLTDNTLPVEGGTLAVGFQSDEQGVHEGYVKLSSQGAADQYVMMSVLVKQETAVVSAEQSQLAVWTEQQTLHVHGATLEHVRIYTLDGRCTVDCDAHQTITLPLTKGIFLLQAVTQQGIVTDRIVIE